MPLPALHQRTVQATDKNVPTDCVCSGWLLTGAPLCGGRSFALLERFFRPTAELVTGTPCPSAYPAMLRALEAPMPDDVPQFRTTFAGTRQDPAERAVLSGLDEENFAPVPLLHALLRGMADELSACYRAALKAGCAPAGRLLGSGNGLRRNPALQRAVTRCRCVNSVVANVVTAVNMAAERITPMIVTIVRMRFARMERCATR